MFVFIGNTPRDYAWGSTDALPEMLGTSPTGAPQAELWLGSHPGDPAEVAKATPVAQTLIDLIRSDPERYGVDGEELPFLLKVLAIGSPLSLQVHPTREQAEAGFLAEEIAGVARDASTRNYRDRNHKPEMVVALDDRFRALCGFRSLGDAAADVRGLARAVPSGDPGRALLEALADRMDDAPDAAQSRRALVSWLFSKDPSVTAVQDALRAATEAAVTQSATGTVVETPDSGRLDGLAELVRTHPGDPGVLVSLLMHQIALAEGEALYLPPGHLHAYLSGVAVEVMASSDNVLRAGLTPKHIDISELSRIMVADELADPTLVPSHPIPGITLWEVPLADFLLARIRVQAGAVGAAPGEPARQVSGPADYPLVVIATQGRLRVERVSEHLNEVASLARGQALYISAGDPVSVSGSGEAFVATVGRHWG